MRTLLSQPVRRAVGLTALGFGAFGAAMLIGHRVMLPPLEGLTGSLETSSSATGSRDVRPGIEIAVVYVGSPTCAWSNIDALPTMVRTIHRHIRDQADSVGYGFATIGISKSATVTAGIAHLTSIGQFDEVMTGRGWYNTGTLRYVYQTLTGPAATPQIVVLTRDIATRTEPAITNERVIARLVGAGAIANWAAAGAPVFRYESATIDDATTTH